MKPSTRRWPRRVNCPDWKTVPTATSRCQPWLRQMNVPLVDSRMLSFYAVRFAFDLRGAILDDLVSNCLWLEALGPRYLVRGEPMPLTRIADILISMDAE